MGYYEGDLQVGSGCNNGSMWGGDGAIWAILLLALLGGRWGYGNNGVGGGSTFSEGLGYELGKVATTNDVASGFSTSTMMSALDDIKLTQASNLNFINQGFSGLNNVISTGFAGVNNAICTLGYQNQAGINQLSRELGDCCCTTQRAIDGINYNMATNTCAITNAIQTSTRDIVDNQNANYRALHDEIVANRIEDKNARIAELEAKVNALNLAQSQANQNAYLINTLRPTPSPSYTVPNPYCCYGYNGGCNGVQ